MSTPEPGVDQSEDQGKKQLTNYLFTYGRVAGIASALTMSVIFAFGAWYALHEAGVKKPVMTKIPLIRADPGPLKVKPKNPGGLKIPNQDKLVFERITPEKRITREEKLAPEPEEPIATSKIKNGNAGPQISGRLIIPEPKKKWKPKLTSPNGVVINNEKSNFVYKIQLAAFRKKGQAEASWTKLKNIHAEILGKLIPLTVKVDLGKKGVYFRLQAGHFTMLETAQSTCEKLKARGQGCIITRPK